MPSLRNRRPASLAFRTAVCQAIQFRHDGLLLEQTFRSRPPLQDQLFNEFDGRGSAQCAALSDELRHVAAPLFALSPLRHGAARRGASEQESGNMVGKEQGFTDRRVGTVSLFIASLTLAGTSAVTFLCHCGWLSKSAQRWRSEKSWHGPCVHLSRSLQSNAWWQMMAGWQAVSRPSAAGGGGTEEVRGISPRTPHRTVRDTLASYGSCHRKKARRLSVALLGSSRFRLAQRNCNDPPPSLHGHYTHFITTMGQSDPERCIGTFGLMAVATCAFSLGITVQVHLFCTKARMKVTPPEHRTPHGL